MLPLVMILACGPTFPSNDRVEKHSIPDFSSLAHITESDIRSGGMLGTTSEAPSTASHPWAALPEGWVLSAGAVITEDASIAAPIVMALPAEGHVSMQLAVDARTEGLTPKPGGSGATVTIEERDANGESVVRHTYLRQLTGSNPDTTIRADFTTHRSTEQLVVTLSAGDAVAGRVEFENVRTGRKSGLEAFVDSPRVQDGSFVKHLTLNRDTRMGWALAPRTTVSQTLSAGPERLLRFAVGGPNSKKACLVVAIDGSENNFCSAKNGRWREHRVAVPSSPGDTALSWRTGDLTGGGLLLANPTVAPVTPTPPEIPNVVLLVVDTLRGDAVGWADSDTTPRLDELATRSIVFDHAYSTSSWTAPSMGSMVTSVYPLEHGAGIRVPFAERQDNSNNTQLRKNELNYGLLDRSRTTIAERMHAAGFETVGFYTNYFFSSRVGFDQGFERYQQYSGSGARGATPGADLVKDWIGERDDTRPFFLTFHVVDPHLPYHSRKSVAKQFPPEHVDGLTIDEKKGLAKLPKVTRAGRNQPEGLRALYDDEIRWADRVLGDIIHTLDEVAPNTTIILTSDHGEAFGEHGAFVHGNILFDELVHIPMLVRPPGGVVGRHESTPVSLLDVAPTIAHAGGIEAPTEWLGHSLLAEIPPRTLLMTGVYSGPDRAAGLRWPHKLVWRLPERHVGFSPRKGQKTQLSDLEATPDESKAITAPERKRAIHDEIVTHLMRFRPGLHLWCNASGESVEVRVETPSAVGQIVTPTLEKSDRTTLSDDRRTFEGVMTHDDDWLVIRGRFALGESRVFIGTTETPILREYPKQPPQAGQCSAWWIAVPGHGLVGDEAGSEALEELRALGYVD